MSKVRSSHAKGSDASVLQEWQSLTQVRLKMDGNVFLGGPGVNVCETL